MFVMITVWHCGGRSMMLRQLKEPIETILKGGNLYLVLSFYLIAV